MHPQHSWMFYIAILGRYSAFLKEGELLIASAEVVGPLPNPHKQCGVLRRLHIRFPARQRTGSYAQKAHQRVRLLQPLLAVCSPSFF